MDKRLRITFEGTSPLLMNRFPEVAPEGLQKMSRNDQAEVAAYRDTAGVLFVPGVNIHRCLIAGAAYTKKGRGTLAKIAAACLLVEDEKVSLNVREYEVDARPVVIPATKGRIMRFRPRLDTWKISFFMIYDAGLLNIEEVHRILEDSGRRVGLLDFRPERKGPFGRFVVKEVSEA